MDSLLVIFAVLGAAFADIPLKVDTETDAAREFPLTSSDYLKTVFDRSRGTVDAVAIAPVDVIDLIFTLNKYGLTDAEEIAWSIDLIDVLQDNRLGSLTLFAPTNDAIRKWKQDFPLDPANPADRARMIQLVKAWIVPNAALTLWDLQVDEVRLRTLANVGLRINRYYQAGQLTINGAPIVNDVDIRSNGNTIHVIDKMIFPLPDGNVIEEMDRAGHFTTFIKLIQTGGAQDFFAYANDLTIFAPTDRACDNVPAKIADLQANITKLISVLKYHVVRKTFYSAAFRGTQSIRSMTGDDIVLYYDQENDEYKLNWDPTQPDAVTRVVIWDMPASNGVIHVIDKVLDLPQKRQEEMEASFSDSQFYF